MPYFRTLLCRTLIPVALVLLTSCTTEEDEIRFRAQRLVDRRATSGEAEMEFGAASRVFTREEVLGYLEKSPGVDQAIREDWERIAKYPRTLYFSPGQREQMRQLYLFLDDENRVAGFYLTSQ